MATLERALLDATIDNRYRILRVLGHGGMGFVFLAADGKFDGKLVAIKVLRPAQDGEDTVALDAKRRFAREVRLSSKIAHQNIAQVFDCGVAFLAAAPSGLPYLVMEYIEGESLADLIAREARLPVPRALQLLLQLAQALAAAARKGIVHRDIKPQNVMLQGHRVGNAWHLKLLDFGIAKIIQEAEVRTAVPDAPLEEVAAHLTRAGLIIGTPTYMAPEQILDNLGAATAKMRRDPDAPIPPMGPRADLYSAGVMFYRMISGRLPFSGPLAIVLTAHLNRDVPPLPADIPEAVRALCLRLLEKDPAKRPESADVLIEEIEECLQITQELSRMAAAPLPTPRVSAPSVPEKADASTRIAPPPPDRRWRWIVGVGLVAALLLAVVYGMTAELPRPPAPASRSDGPQPSEARAVAPLPDLHAPDLRSPPDLSADLSTPVRRRHPPRSRDMGGADVKPVSATPPCAYILNAEGVPVPGPTCQ